MPRGRLPDEGIISRIKQTIGEAHGLTQREISERTGIPIQTVHRYVTKYLKDVLIVKKAGKKKLIALKSPEAKSATELLLEKVKKTLDFGSRLRENGHSYAEIVREIRRSYGISLSEVTAYTKFRDVRFSDKGLQRYKEKISSDRSKAGKIGGAKLAKSGLLDKIRPSAVEAARRARLKAIPPSAKELTLEKVRVIAHCLFDGFVRKDVFGYVNASEALVMRFKSDVKRVYGFDPSDERVKGKAICVRFASKLAAEDLLTYMPNYSTRKNTFAKVPDLIVNGSMEWKKEFLRCFWDDEGSCVFNMRTGDGEEVVRQLEAFCENDDVRRSLIELHKSLGIDCYERDNKIIISKREDLTKFSEEINFSAGVEVEKGIIWRGFEKREVLRHMLESYDRRRSVYIENYGCASNKFDLQIMLAYLMKAGYEISNVPESADILIINTCGVKTPTEDKILARLRSLNSLRKPIIIAGCLPKINLPAIQRCVSDYSAVLDPYSCDKILLAVKGAERGEKNKEFFSQKPKVKLKLPRVRTNDVVEVIQIAEGCAGFCAYCCTRFARGRLFSYPKELIVNNIKRAVRDGVKEVWITGQDTGAYGIDIETDLVELLEDVCKIDGDFLVRVGMMNPNHALRMLHRLIEVYKDEKIFKFLHLPVQSGDDEVLKRMKRLYSVDDFKHVVKAFREAFPDISLATDVIVGFPGESEEEFEGTLRLIEDVKPDIVNVSKFFPRPSTEAARMKPKVDVNIVKARSKSISELASKISLERNLRWLGWSGHALIDEVGLKPNTWIGRNYAYKPIVVKSQEPSLGDILEVEVVNAHSTYLEGVILSWRLKALNARVKAVEMRPLEGDFD